MHGGSAIAKILKAEGVEQVFCFPLTPILEALVDEGIRPIVARQERVAENMADGFSRATGGERIGVVTVQHSAGAETITTWPGDSVLTPSASSGPKRSVPLSSVA